MLGNIIQVDHKLQDYVSFGQIGLGRFFGKTGNSYFCQSIVPHHTKMLKLKKNPYRGSGDIGFSNFNAK